MIYPFSPFKIDTVFGHRESYGYHEAVDLNGLGGGDTDLGYPLMAIAGGEVTSVHSHTTGFGNHLHYKIIGPWGEVWCHYAHCNKILVAQGAKIKEGQTVAGLGKSGNSDLAHLHFAIKLQPTGIDAIAKTEADLAKWTDPLAFIEKWKNYTFNEEADEQRAISILKANKGTVWGNLEGMTASLVATHRSYTDLDLRFKRFLEGLQSRLGLGPQDEEDAIYEAVTRLMTDEDNHRILRDAVESFIGRTFESDVARLKAIKGLEEARLQELEIIKRQRDAALIKLEEWHKRESQELLKVVRFLRLVIKIYKEGG